MLGLIAGLSVGLLVLGVIVFVMGLRKRPVVEHPTAPLRQRLRLARLVSSMTVGQKRLGAAGLVVGVLLALVARWPLLVVVMPVAFIGIPWLLSPPGKGDIDKLAAMEDWTRSLAGILTGGMTLKAALVATLRSTPAPIRPQVSRLVNKIHAGMPLEPALRKFGDDLNDPTGDLIVINLLFGCTVAPRGLASTLDGLASTVSLDVTDRRQLEAEAAKSRGSARIITIITLAFLVFMLVLGRGYLAPYGSPVGQILLAVLLAAYGWLLMMIRKMSATPPLPRFMGAASAKGLTR